MQKKRFAVVGYIFGEKYQSFAALYAYSILRAYPEYSVLLYFDGGILSDLRERLWRLTELGDVRFRENYDFGRPSSGGAAKAFNVMKAGRWLFVDEWFKEFNWLYIGDVDILILPEATPLLESHVAHAQMLGLPYSNVIRLTADARQLTPGALRALWLARDIDTFRRRVRGEVIPRDRLSGLHFIERDPYFAAAEPLFSTFKEEILANAPATRARDDEELLYQLVAASSLGLPPVSPTGPDLDATHFGSVNDRPHHGIHLGIFRSAGSILRQRQVLNSYVYRDHYAKYRELCADAEFRAIRGECSGFIRGLLDAVDKYIASGD